jgi:hypothetical protein
MKVLLVSWDATTELRDDWVGGHRLNISTPEGERRFDVVGLVGEDTRVAIERFVSPEENRNILESRDKAVAAFHERTWRAIMHGIRTYRR